jgi:hypothetical protein
MCFYGFAISLEKTETIWARYVLCISWVLLFGFSFLGQGNVYRTKFILAVDTAIAIVIFLVYLYLYLKSMIWWHYVGSILAIGVFFYMTMKYVPDPSPEYEWIVNIWHLWIILMIFLVPNTLEENKLF